VAREQGEIQVSSQKRTFLPEPITQWYPDQIAGATQEIPFQKGKIAVLLLIFWEKCCIYIQ
jgi:hypothetical protein